LEDFAQISVGELCYRIGGVSNHDVENTMFRRDLLRAKIS